MARVASPFPLIRCICSDGRWYKHTRKHWTNTHSVITIVFVRHVLFLFSWVEDSFPRSLDSYKVLSFVFCYVILIELFQCAQKKGFLSTFDRLCMLPFGHHNSIRSHLCPYNCPLQLVQLNIQHLNRIDANPYRNVQGLLIGQFEWGFDLEFESNFPFYRFTGLTRLDDWLSRRGILWSIDFGDLHLSLPSLCFNKYSSMHSKVAFFVVHSFDRCSHRRWIYPSTKLCDFLPSLSHT